MRVGVLTLSAVGVLIAICTGCTTGPTTALPTATAMSVVQGVACEMKDGTAITSAFLPLTTRWGDAVALADNTPRIGLSGPVGQLQAIRRDVEAIDWPPCARRAADLLTEGMNTVIRGYLGFMSGHRPDETRTIPDVGTLTYSYLAQVSGVDEANRIFDAEYHADIARGRQILGEFGTELAYATAEQPQSN